MAAQKTEQVTSLPTGEEWKFLISSFSCTYYVPSIGHMAVSKADNLALAALTLLKNLQGLPRWLGKNPTCQGASKPAVESHNYRLARCSY